MNVGFALLIKVADIKKITPHGLRHAHATILLNRKVSVATVAKRLGYTANEINRDYGQSDGDADLQTVEFFSAIHM
ncbi:tyrosine-type recombinase/integrase [Oceanobacillus sp. FSL H7-0719]|uniref:tyrosine-type recombinase/integrase n=1 Tax=Oceanobacillus sp. FSL H7-0719 TaxID=2954507 RepID=UPI003863359B